MHGPAHGARRRWARAVVFVACSGLLSGCGGADGMLPPANPLRAAIEDDIAALDDERPLPARYNPAACACPPLELRIGARWLRAAWVSSDRAEELARTLDVLAAEPRGRWPLPLVARGKVDSSARRTAQGEYAVLIDLSALERVGPSRDVLPTPPRAAPPLAPLDGQAEPAAAPPKPAE